MQALASKPSVSKLNRKAANVNDKNISDFKSFNHQLKMSVANPTTDNEEQLKIVDQGSAQPRPSMLDIFTYDPNVTLSLLAENQKQFYMDAMHLGACLSNLANNHKKMQSRYKTRYFDIWKLQTLLKSRRQQPMSLNDTLTSSYQSDCI